MDIRLLWAVLALSLPACDPRLPIDPSAPGPGTGSGGAGGLTVTSEPAAPLDAAPRVMRLHASFSGQPLDPARVVLLEGSVGPGQLHELFTGKVSKALASREIEASTWADGDEAVIAPHTPLDPGAAYTLVAAQLPEAVPVRIAASDTAPLLARVWPPAGASGTAGFAVWCGDAPILRVDEAVTLAPGAIPGRVRRGAVESGAGERCVRFEAGVASAEGGVPPPLVTSATGGAMTICLDPRPLAFDVAVSAPVALSCDDDEIAFGPGCAIVADDRLSLRSPASPLLWAVAGEGVDVVQATGPNDELVITGLTPSTLVTLDVAAVDASGTVVRALVQAQTDAPAPHLILNEVLADPLGPEPAQEWVEIVNDGQAPADLEGYSLLDGGGATPLPAGTLLPGQLALIVNETFQISDAADVPPAAGTLLLRVPKLGTHGLSNSGEALSLTDPQGNVVSRFPASPKPKPGVSLARRAPSLPDGQQSSFALALPSPGRTNTW